MFFKHGKNRKTFTEVMSNECYERVIHKEIENSKRLLKSQGGKKII